MKKILSIFLFISVAVLPIYAHNCSKYSQYSEGQQLLFYMQDNDARCVQAILGPDPKENPSLYWKTNDMCVDLLYYWVHKGHQDTYETIAYSLISHGADMTRKYCRQSAIGAAADLAIADINKKGNYSESYNSIKRFKYLLSVGKKDNVVNKISPNFLQYSMNKTGAITNQFVKLLLDYGIYVTQEDIKYAESNKYWDIYELLVTPEEDTKLPLYAGGKMQNNAYAAMQASYHKK